MATVTKVQKIAIINDVLHGLYIAKLVKSAEAIESYMLEAAVLHLTDDDKYLRDVLGKRAKDFITAKTSVRFAVLLPGDQYNTNCYTKDFLVSSIITVKGNTTSKIELPKGYYCSITARARSELPLTKPQLKKLTTLVKANRKIMEEIREECSKLDCILSTMRSPKKVLEMFPNAEKQLNLVPPIINNLPVPIEDLKRYNKALEKPEVKS